MDRHRVVRAAFLSLIAIAMTGALWSASAGGATAADARPAVAQVPRLTWHRCSGVVRTGFQCATARAPLDYRHPRGKTIKLAVIRHRASEPSRRIGTLFYNPGGPAASKPILPVALEALPKVWRERFDVVTWDLRGLGESTPVRCFASQPAEDRFLAGVGKPALSFPVGPTQTSRWIRRWAAFGGRCQERSGALLAHVSTADSARDMDLLRRASGERQVTYLGTSYGTFLGATYANLFPHRVRAMVLISAINPVAWVSRGRAPSGNRGAFSPTYLRQATDLGARKTLNAFLGLCGRTSTARCAFSAGSPAATRAKFAALLRGLPRASGQRVSYAKLVGIVVNYLYVSASWSELARQLQNVWTTGSPGEAIPDQFAGIGGTLAINCSDSPNPGAAGFQKAGAIAYRRSGAVGSFWTWASEPCATWPATAAARYAGPWNRRTANPVLVIGNTYDPSTPYAAAVALSRELGRARLLTVDGYGHGAASLCANRHITSYLVNRTLPPPRTTCAAEQPFASRR